MGRRLHVSTVGTFTPSSVYTPLADNKPKPGTFKTGLVPFVVLVRDGIGG